MAQCNHIGLDPTKWKVGDLVAVASARAGRATIRAAVYVSIVGQNVNLRMMDTGRLLAVPFDRVARLG